MFVFLVAIATESLAGDVRADVDALTLVATIFVFHVAVLTVHVAGRLQRTLGIRGTSAHLAAIAITEESEFAVHHAHEIWALVTWSSFTLAEVAPVGILLKAIFAVHGTHDRAAHRIFSTLTDVTTI
jgi:hypothetical protein